MTEEVVSWKGNAAAAATCDSESEYSHYFAEELVTTFSLSGHNKPRMVNANEGDLGTG